MKIKYRQATASDYSRRAARAQAKKVVLAQLSEILRQALEDDLAPSAAVTRLALEQLTDGWTAEWRAGTRGELRAAVEELRTEFDRRSA